MVVASVGAGVIHFAVAPAHFGEYWLFGAFFLAAGLFQVGTAVLMQINLSPSLVATICVVNGLIVMIWLASRTAGLPVGPHAFTAEEIAAADATSTALEVLIVAGGVLLLTTTRKEMNASHVKWFARDRRSYER